LREELDEMTRKVIGGAIAVHRQLGPGLLESTYEACLAYELAEQGLAVERQKELPVIYRGVRLDCGYRIDMLIGGKVVLELKAVDQLLPIHEAHLLSYLKLSGCKLGLLINFNVKLLTEGLKRIANGSLD
jgi:GxxExxY protein